MSEPLPPNPETKAALDAMCAGTPQPVPDPPAYPEDAAEQESTPEAQPEEQRAEGAPTFEARLVALGENGTLLREKIDEMIGQFEGEKVGPILGGILSFITEPEGHGGRFGLVAHEFGDSLLLRGLSEVLAEHRAEASRRYQRRSAARDLLASLLGEKEIKVEVVEMDDDPFAGCGDPDCPSCGAEAGEKPAEG